MAVNNKEGNQYLYALRARVIDLDSKKVSLWPGKKYLEHNSQKVFNLGVKPENFWIEYVGISTDPNKRLDIHFSKENDFIHLFKEKPPFVHMEFIGWCWTEEAETLEKLYLENRDEFYLRLFLDHKIFVWPYGPYYKNGGGAQKEHPYPDNKHDWMPRWYRNNQDKIEAAIAAQNITDENVIV